MSALLWVRAHGASLFIHTLTMSDLPCFFLGGVFFWITPNPLWLLIVFHTTIMAHSMMVRNRYFLFLTGPLTLSM